MGELELLRTLHSRHRPLTSSHLPRQPRGWFVQLNMVILAMGKLLRQERFGRCEAVGRERVEKWAGGRM